MSGLLRNLWVGIEVESLFLVFMDNLLPLCKVVIVAKNLIRIHLRARDFRMLVSVWHDSVHLLKLLNSHKYCFGEIYFGCTQLKGKII
jgi:hypothetical protein